jgi:hypothetical protein
VVLEGGYSLEALERSSESVFKVMGTHPDDKEGYQQVLETYGATEENNTYEKQVKQAVMFPRYSFRVTMSNLAKLLKKTWGKTVEGLIFEKPRRKSSAKSKSSGENKSESDPM